MMNTGQPMYQPLNTQMSGAFSGAPNQSDLKITPLYRTANESPIDQRNNQTKLMAMNKFITNNPQGGFHA